MQFARIVAALALVASGACADGGLSKEDFIEQADALCREADEKSEQLEPPRSPEDLKEFAEKATEITEDLARQLRELEPPEGDADVINEMIERIEGAIGLLPDIQAATEQRDTEELERLVADLREESSEANRIAREYGLESCGRAEPAAP